MMREPLNTNEDKEIIKAITNIARNFHASDTTGHDWFHIWRVCKMAKHIAHHEGANMLEVELAALLHDMDDHKIEGSDEENLPKARQALLSAKIQELLLTKVLQIIRQVSFKGARVNAKPNSLEACVVQDADRLDAMGAIGIARAFAFGGSKGFEMYNPEAKPVMHESFKDYKSSNSSTINHFYEKLLLLKDMLNTDTAKSIASRRHAYMEEFVERFLVEWNFRE
ncbi:MAG: HD domain-containing protein [Bacteroidales bacterium]